MTPRLPVDHLRDARAADAVFSHEVRNRTVHPWRRTYVSNGFFRKKGIVVLFSGRRRTVKFCASARDHVSDVVLGGPRVQMLRIAARWVVATVADEESVRDRTVDDLPREPMNPDVLLMHADDSVVLDPAHGPLHAARFRPAAPGHDELDSDRIWESELRHAVRLPRQWSKSNGGAG